MRRRWPLELASSFGRSRNHTTVCFCQRHLPTKACFDRLPHSDNVDNYHRSSKSCHSTLQLFSWSVFLIPYSLKHPAYLPPDKVQRSPQPVAVQSSGVPARLANARLTRWWGVGAPDSDRLHSHACRKRLRTAHNQHQLQDGAVLRTCNLASSGRGGNSNDSRSQTHELGRIAVYKAVIWPDCRHELVIQAAGSSYPEDPEPSVEAEQASASRGPRRDGTTLTPILYH